MNNLKSTEYCFHFEMLLCCLFKICEAGRGGGDGNDVPDMGRQSPVSTLRCEY